MDRSRIVRHRSSLTSTGSKNRTRGAQRKVDPELEVVGRGRISDEHGNPRGGGGLRDGAAVRAQRPSPPAERERSLSPFSKRVALTQAMNMGR
jgi:hypothetical protein